MRRPNVKLQSDRRAEILAAAERCFIRSGFHRASIQDICAEAGMSPGNLYRYFDSKEAIIAGICERDRAEVVQQLATANFRTDFWNTFATLARHHVVERPTEDVSLCAEIMTESRRNPDIARIFEAFDADVRSRLVAILKEAAERGDVAADIDFENIVTMLMVIVDGVWWRRAVDPNFDAEAVLPLFLHLTKHMLRGGANGLRREREKSYES
ncbi:MAG TPA: TetR/AcrR family transcriptional regulator [Xanthobacteraceae bacterium]|nr:TetR/AcrR family transcriptional regulator [Xanthobacteraceae bacterium]